ncbi:DNA topoisomerase 2 [Artemisia annua]|uniref:DNA topoisomerase (ATP-hydrolyzing) n=1 Tax=Artemisia annua TaxID=35608 RepID=A0A2U1LVJ1_ARTAN|nr:DNA topoisomerase 2 [Artemisia annua]
MATDGKRKGKLNIPQLKDANLAGTANSGDCTLILTVGYSAKSFAMSGLSVVGQDKYGVFPLKGNLLNVRKSSPQRVQRNAKIQEIKNILGLQDGKTYENIKELRYGHLLIMATDQDHDGSNMIGLLINFLHYFWPSLLKVKNNFMQMCRTPIVKASDKKTNEQLETFEREEVKEYFADLDHHIENFGLVDDKDGDVIELAYGKNIEARRNGFKHLIRKSSPQRVQRNAKIQEIKNILGLQDGKTYENIKELRYGHLLIMATDQDHDGSNMIGLLINFLHYFWPSLLKVKNNFMQMCRTPIVKASDKKTNEQLETFEREEVKEYFADLDHHIENFGLVDDKDGDVIELAYVMFTKIFSQVFMAKRYDALIRQLDDEKYPLTEKRAPAKRARDAAGPQRANKKSSMWVSDSDATEDSDFEDEE